jgi:hypothetical protein
MSDDQLSDQRQDQGCKIQNKTQEPCKPTDKISASTQISNKSKGI